jgi:L-aspartate oxidase
MTKPEKPHPAAASPPAESPETPDQSTVKHLEPPLHKIAPEHPRRYLAAFDPRDLPNHFTDVLVIGGGLAGMRTAIGIPPEFRVLVVTKQELQESNSAYAQGGIAGVLDPEDAFADHIADTLSAGKGLCNTAVVQSVVTEAPARIADLIQWGTRFDLENGTVALGREGGHSHARIVHALGDATGREVMRAVIAKAESQRNLRFWQNSFTVDLITYDGRCRGAIVWDRKRGMSIVWARAVVLATGGAGQLYRESTNPPIATGDGHSLAFRAGARLRDLEFMQFHPTVLYIAGSSRHLITEAVRGEGAYLRDRAGIRFMPGVHPLAELAPRDDVSRAIWDRMAATQHPCVYLDLSHLDKDHVLKRFPGIAELCRGFDLDITVDQIPVRPGAHYYIGGVEVDPHGRSTVEGLWAAGEVTSSGLHGANRLASNSLLEGLVYGARIAEDIVSQLKQEPNPSLVVPPVKCAAPLTPQGLRIDIADVKHALKALMVRSVGLAREQQKLQEAADQVDFWSRYALEQVFDDPEGWVLQNMLTLSRAMIDAALTRTETRGVHFRTDFPEPSDTWRRHISYTLEGTQQ